MNLQKIIAKINGFLHKKPKGGRGFTQQDKTLWSKRKKRNKKLYLKKTKQKSLIKKRRSFSIKNKHIEKLKIFGNNITHYYILILVIVFITSLYIIFGPIFRIKNIEIIKQDNITSMHIAYKAVDYYRGKSIINIEKKDILKRLQDYQHNIRDIKIDIILPNTLKILIDSYKGIYNTTINGKAFLITANGTLVPANYSEELKTLIIKNKFDINKFLDFKKEFKTEYILKISDIIKSLEENIINLEIDEITYFVIERELHIETGKKITLIFDLNGNHKEQIEKLVIFNKDYLNIDKNPIVYIDLRIKNKVFYCTNENEYQCIQNIKKIYSYE
ncbi:MAG: hypothetical protein QM490_01040 [Candidatus Gracilibacteria bacterium]